MNRALLFVALLSASACSRSSTRPAARPTQPTRAAAATPPIAALGAGETPEREAEEQRAIMEAMRQVSAFPATDEGARGFALELQRAAASGDHERWERAERELLVDDSRFELAMTFDGARQLRERVVPTMEARGRTLRERLATLREPLTVRVTSALGERISAGEAPGFSAGMTAVRALVRPAVRFYRVDVVGQDGAAVSLEPMAWLAGRWTWLGEPWSALPTQPAQPVAAPPSGVTAQR